MNRTIRARSFDDVITKSKPKSDNKIWEQRKKEQTLNGPLLPYVNWVIKNACERMNIKFEEAVGKCKVDELVEARTYIVIIVSSNTDLYTKSMWFINRDRTTFYHSMDMIETYLMDKSKAKLFEELKLLCSMEAYNREVSSNITVDNIV